jgi:glycosyltransferase involved in cell wall biosynthesis
VGGSAGESDRSKGLVKAAAEPGGPRPLRVLFVTHSLTGGGAERFVSTLAGALDRRRFAPEVALATGRAGYPLPQDVPAANLGYRSFAHLPVAVGRLCLLIRRRRPDLVVSNVLSTNCLAGAALATLPAAERPPWVARLGNAPGVGEPWGQRAFARRVYPLARRIVANSEGLRGAFVGRHPALAGRTLALPNPVDFARLDALAAQPPDHAPAPGAATLLAAGRLVRQKRPDLMVEVLARLRRRRDVRLWLCGEGPLARRTAARAAALGIGGELVRLGFCENPFALMRHADLFLSTSDFEGLPNALIEAQGLGLPAVATRCPHGPDEIVADGETGRLVPTGDAVALAAAAEELLADPERRLRMGAAARERARRLSDLGVVVPRWEALLAEAATAAEAP